MITNGAWQIGLGPEKGKGSEPGWERILPREKNSEYLGAHHPKGFTPQPRVFRTQRNVN